MQTTNFYDSINGKKKEHDNNKSYNYIMDQNSFVNANQCRVPFGIMNGLNASTINDTGNRSDFECVFLRGQGTFDSNNEITIKSQNEKRTVNIQTQHLKDCNFNFN